MLDQLAKLGAPPAVLAAARQRIEDEAAQATTPVWPENWHAVSLFMAMATQWHWITAPGVAQRIGLRYEALPAVRAAVQASVPKRWRKPWPELLRQLQVMEDAALSEIKRMHG